MKVYTGGTFDLFHHGHVRFLRMCAEFGPVTVALNTDDFVRRFKGHPPVMDFGERYQVLDGCRYVDKVVANERGEFSGPSIEREDPDLIAIGTDWLERDYLGQLGVTAEWLRQHEIGLIYLPYTVTISSTEIRDRLVRP